MSANTKAIIRNITEGKERKKLALSEKRAAKGELRRGGETTK